MQVWLYLRPNSLYLTGVRSFWLQKPAGPLVGVAYLVSAVGVYLIAQQNDTEKGLLGDSDKFCNFISLGFYSPSLLLLLIPSRSHGLPSRISVALRCFSAPSASNIDFLANLIFSKFSLSNCYYLNLAASCLCYSSIFIFWNSLPSKLFTFVRSVLFLVLCLTVSYAAAPCDFFSFTSFWYASLKFLGLSSYSDSCATLIGIWDLALSLWAF